ARVGDYFFDGPGKRILTRHSIVLLMNRGHEIAHVGVVVKREKEDFLEGSKEAHHGVQFFQVGIQFSGEQSYKHLIPMMSRKTPHAHAPSLADFVFQSSASFFAYEPVLRALQSMTSIP